MRKAITIEEMIKKQNYKPIDKEKFYNEISGLNIEEPLEELLSMLSK